MKEPVTFIFDVDGTICPIKKNTEEYEDLVPYPAIVQKMQEYKQEGAKIILYTSRNMNTHRGSIGKINISTAPILLEWLKKWDIPYDEVIFGKPWPGHCGYYVDDRTVRPREFLECSQDELNIICKKGRFDDE